MADQENGKSRRDLFNEALAKCRDITSNMPVRGLFFMSDNGSVCTLNGATICEAQSINDLQAFLDEWTRKKTEPVPIPTNKLGKDITVCKVRAHELEVIIAKRFGVSDYSIVESEDGNNYSYILKTPEPEQAISEQEVQKAVTASSFSFQKALDFLCKEGLIEEKQYLIDISW